jgi:hypothetical protein
MKLKLVSKIYDYILLCWRFGAVLMVTKHARNEKEKFITLLYLRMEID